MDVSIIIVNYNKFDILRNCLASIVKYTKDLSYEIIIIDNNSSEGSIKEVTDKFQKIVLIQNKSNVGFAAANNQGIKIANGQYCLILNNDTEFFKDGIKEVHDYAESFSSDVVIGCQLLNSNGSKQESAIQFPSLLNIFTENFFLYKLFPKNKFFNKYYLNEISLTSPTNVDVVKGAFLFTKTELLKKVKGFDERFFFYSEETDLCYRLKKHFGTQIILLPEVCVYHHNNADDKLKPWFHFKNISIGKIQYYQKHFNYLNKIIVLSLHFLGNLLRVVLNMLLGVIKRENEYFIKAKYYFRLLFIYPENRFNQK